MTINDQVKILDDKIRANKAQYDLDRQAAKISALNSGEKYEYLTGEDLGYKPDVVPKAKFEYSLLGQVFIKRLDATEKNEGILKRLKNIEDKTDQKLNENKSSQLGVKSIGYAIKEKLSQQAENMLEKLNNQEKLIDYRKLNFKGGNHVDYDFSNFRPLRELFRVIYYGDVIIPGAEREQNEFDDMLEIIKPYRPKKDSKYKKIKDDLVINAQKFYDRREMIINAFKDKKFLYIILMII